jgi:hypothetical protein
VHVVVYLLKSGTDENWNFSAMRSLIELKLGGDLRLLSQISVHALVSRLSCLFTFCKQTNKQKTGIAKITVLKNFEFSPPFLVRLIQGRIWRVSIWVSKPGSPLLWRAPGSSSGKQSEQTQIGKRTENAKEKKLHSNRFCAF